MNRKQKIWSFVFLGAFIVSEVLLGQVLGILSDFFGFPAPVFAEAQILSDQRKLIYLTIVFEIICLLGIVKPQIQALKDRWRLWIIVPSFVLIVYLLIMLWLYYVTRHGIGF